MAEVMEIKHFISAMGVGDSDAVAELQRGQPVRREATFSFTADDDQEITPSDDTPIDTKRAAKHCSGRLARSVWSFC